MNCVFNCGIGNCRNGAKHRCHICGEENSHRSKDCPSTVSCIFKCHYASCRQGNPHRCRMCNALNAHKSKDCPLSKKVELSDVKTDYDPYQEVYTGCSKKIAGLIVLKKINKQWYCLVQKRANWVSSGGMRGFIGGAVDGNEDFYTAAIREASEESCINTRKITPYYSITNDFGSVSKIHVVNFVVVYDGATTWTNSGSHSNEVDDFPDTDYVSSIHATYGHRWCLLDDLKHVKSFLIGGFSVVKNIHTNF